MSEPKRLESWEFGDPAKVAERRELQQMAATRRQAQRDARQWLEIERAFRTNSERDES